MNVVPLARFANRDSILVLQALLEMALSGELSSLALCYRTRRGLEDYAITGGFAADSDRAAAAAVRLSMKLANAKGEYDQPV